MIRDFAFTIRQAFITETSAAVALGEPKATTDDRRARKRADDLQRAKCWLGERYCLRNPSTLEYKPAEFVVPNLANRVRYA